MDDSVFIAYSRKDWEQYVDPLVKYLRARSVNTWIDQHLLEGGDDWLDKINDALEQCACLILCISPDALQSRYVKIEYRYCLQEDKPIIPLICREAKLPAELRGIQNIPFSDLKALVARIERIVGKGEVFEEEIIQRALSNLNSNNLDAAIADYSKVIALNPTSVLSYYKSR